MVLTREIMLSDEAYEVDEGLLSEMGTIADAEVFELAEVLVLGMIVSLDWLISEASPEVPVSSAVLVIGLSAGVLVGAELSEVDCKPVDVEKEESGLGYCLLDCD